MTNIEDILLKHFLMGGNDPSGMLINELLGYFNSALDVERIVPLLESEIDATAEAGAWIISELGERPKKILPVVETLTVHRSPTVRFRAIGCLLNCVDGNDWPVVLKIVERCFDPHKSVRWQALRFFTYVNTQTLRETVKGVTLSSPTSMALPGLRLLCSDDRHAATSAAKKWLESIDPLQQFFAVVVGARAPSNRSLLEQAARSSSATIKDFAVDMLSMRPR